MTDLTASDGHTFSAYRADPVDAPKGAVVVLQEVFGVNPHIRKVADQFASKGYVAIAPSLFDRRRPGVELGYDDNSLTEGLELMRQFGTDKALSDIQRQRRLADSGGTDDKPYPRSRIQYCASARQRRNIRSI